MICLVLVGTKQMEQVMHKTVREGSKTPKTRAEASAATDGALHDMFPVR